MSERRPNFPEMREIEAHILWKVTKISDLFPENQQARATHLILKALVGETVISNGPTSLSLDKLLSQLTSFLTSTARSISIELLERWLHSGSFEAAPELDQVGPLSTTFSTTPVRRQQNLSETENGGERFLPQHKKRKPR